MHGVWDERFGLAEFVFHFRCPIVPARQTVRTVTQFRPREPRNFFLICLRKPEKKLGKPWGNQAYFQRSVLLRGGGGRTLNMSDLNERGNVNRLRQLGGASDTR